MINKNVPFAIACADLHLSDKPPISRSAEKDWFAAMRRNLKQISDQTGGLELDILYAGDIFDHWNPSAELINFAMRYLPPGFCVAGQHELPNHDFIQFGRSALCTLVQAQSLSLLHPNTVTQRYNRPLQYYGCSWNQKPHKVKREKDVIKVLVMHKYVWSESSNAFKGAKGHDHVKHLPEEVLTYDFIITGDNHKPFVFQFNEECVLLNCGSIMARNSDQRAYQPQMWLLRMNGTIEGIDFPTEKDKWIPEEEEIPLFDGHKTIQELAEVFKQLASQPVSFTEMLTKAINNPKVQQSVKDIIHEALTEALKK